MSGTCIIVTGGDRPHPGARAQLPAAAHVIAADSGLDHADALGLPVDLVIGDLDSVSKESLHDALRRGVPVEEHPATKDQTDLELALHAAMAADPDRILVVSGGGGRLDHLLAGLLALTVPRHTTSGAAVAIEALVGAARVAAIRGPGHLTVVGRPGELVTLVPIGGPAEGITTQGLRYPLTGETLDPGSSRGVSNELLGATATVHVAAGTLIAIQPDHLEVAP
jgi:thiamine pyrophosphokinase